MALKAQLEQWQAAVEAYDSGDFNGALDFLEPIASTSKIHFNIGVILYQVGDFESALKSFLSAVYLDKYFAIAYVQKGMCNVKIGDWEGAFDDFNDALLYLRGNMHIDYHQLGLEYKLFSCEILHNRGLCYLHLGDHDLGRKDIEMAIQEKQTPEHDRINDALSNKKWRKCEFFQLQPGKIFRPSSDKIKNVKKKDYLGKSALISSVDNSDTHTGFKGAAERRAQIELLKTPGTAGIPILSRSVSAHQSARNDEDLAMNASNLRRQHSDVSLIKAKEKGFNEPNYPLYNNSSLTPVDSRYTVGNQRSFSQDQYVRSNSPLQGQSSPGISRPQETRFRSTSPAIQARSFSPSPTKSQDPYARSNSPHYMGSQSPSFQASNDPYIRSNSPHYMRSQSPSITGTYDSYARSISPARVTRSPSPNAAWTPDTYAESNSPIRRTRSPSPNVAGAHSPRSIREPSPGNGVSQRGLARISTAKLPPRKNSLSPAVSPSRGFYTEQGTLPKGVLKVKCHYHETRVFMLASGVTYEALRNILIEKLEAPPSLIIKYINRQKDLALLSNRDDLELAKALRPGKLDLWCFD